MKIGILGQRGGWHVTALQEALARWHPWLAGPQGCDRECASAGDFSGFARALVTPNDRGGRFFATLRMTINHLTEEGASPDATGNVQDTETVFEGFAVQTADGLIFTAKG